MHPKKEDVGIFSKPTNVDVTFVLRHGIIFIVDELGLFFPTSAKLKEVPTGNYLNKKIDRISVIFFFSFSNYTIL